MTSSCPSSRTRYRYQRPRRDDGAVCCRDGGQLEHNPRFRSAAACCDTCAYHAWPDGCSPADPGSGPDRWPRR